MKRIKNALRHLFIPSESNNFRAKAIHVDFLTYYLIFALFFTFAFKKTGNYFHNVLGFATDISIQKLYTLTNEERQKQNLPILSLNEKLSLAAQKKAEDMFLKNYWAHYAPDGVTPWNFILASGYQYEYAGENLAKNFLFSQDVVSAWMASKTHRENIEKKEYTEIGYAVVNGVLNGEETTLVIQMFGKPAGSSVVASAQQSQQSIKEEPVPTSPVAPKRSEVKQASIAPIAFNVNILFLGFLFFALAMDVYFATKYHMLRVGGKNIAHIIFISFLFLGLLFFTKGTIL